MLPYGHLGAGLAPLGLVSAVACNNTTFFALGNHLIQVPYCGDTSIHAFTVLPLAVGGFMLSNTTIRMMRLWGMEIYNWLKK